VKHADLLPVCFTSLVYSSNLKIVATFFSEALTIFQSITRCYIPQVTCHHKGLWVPCNQDDYAPTYIWLMQVKMISVLDTPSSRVYVTLWSPYCSCPWRSPALCSSDKDWSVCYKLNPCVPLRLCAEISRFFSPPIYNQKHLVCGTACNSSCNRP
jgi:hypothetical protein